MPRPAKKPAKSAAAPPRSVPPLASKARGVSWWIAACGPDQREEFITAARARNVEGQSEAVWQRPDNFAQLGPKSA